MCFQLAEMIGGDLTFETETNRHGPTHVDDWI
jgi:hypothetical protein